MPKLVESEVFYPLDMEQPPEPVAVEDQAGNLQDLQSFRLRWLKLLFGLGALAILGLWLSEVFIRGYVNPIDSVAYPVLLVSFSLSIGLLSWRPQAYHLAAWGAVGPLALYGVIYAQAIIWDYSPSQDSYTLSTFPQWFPLIYITIFIFLPQGQALLLSGLIYVSLAVPSLIIAVIERNEPEQARIFPYLLHMMLSHPIYIVVFSGVATLQISLRQAQAQANTMQVRANIDHLTQLANRRAATAFLHTALEQCRMGGLSAGVVLMDVDHFKAVNDTFGHGVGDQVLMHLARLLQSELRKSDLVARWGGEEFLVVLTPTTAAELHQTAERLRQLVAQYPYPRVGQVTASFGITLTQPDDQLETVLDRADNALYQAKQRGRNRVVVARLDP